MWSNSDGIQIGDTTDTQETKKRKGRGKSLFNYNII